MPSTSTISVYVSTFFNYRVAASLWQRDETTAKLDEARPPLESAIHAIFCALPITKIVCVCVCVLARAYTCACLFRLFSLRYVFSTLHLADLIDLHSLPPSLALLFLERKPKRMSPPLFHSGTLKSRHFSPWKTEPSGIFFFFFFFAQKHIYISFIGETVVAKKGRLELAGR